MPPAKPSMKRYWHPTPAPPASATQGVLTEGLNAMMTKMSDGLQRVTSAAKRGDANALRAVLEQQRAAQQEEGAGAVNIDEGLAEALLSAAGSDRVEVVKLLIDVGGVNSNARQPKSGYTALHVAAFGGAWATAQVRSLLLPPRPATAPLPHPSLPRRSSTAAPRST